MRRVGAERWLRKFVTGFGKTLRMEFFQKIEFDAWLISSTQGRVQDLRKVGAEPNARKARAQKILATPPKR